MSEASSSVAVVPRRIVGWERESAEAVVLALDCGHRRHARHRPPLSDHAWVRSDDEVRARIGASIECLRCARRELPEDAEVYRRTDEFDETTVPAGLRRDHETKAGVWGRLVVARGQLTLCFAAPLDCEVQGDPQRSIVIPPQLRHHLRLAGPARFHVEFLRVPARVG